MANELTADLLHRNVEMLKWHISDFADSDLFARPCAGANHAAWQLGHLAASEAGMVNLVAPGAIKLPEGWAQKFDQKAKTNAIDDATKFPTKNELLQTLTDVRSQVIQWANSLSEADLAKKTPEPFKDFAPTVGHLVSMIPMHAVMHLGQIQVIRRKLGKPVLF